MPTVRILMLAGICVGVMLLENPSGVVGTLAAMLVVQAALYAILLFGVAHVVSRLLGRLSPRGVAAVALALLATGVVLAASIDLYRTPFRVASARANVFEIFE